jgi:hypothetical protein
MTEIINIRHLALASLIIFYVVGLVIPADARPPSGASPGNSCLPSYIASHTEKATKIDKSKQRARGNWEYQAWKKFGGKYNDWRKAQFKQYGCSKKGKYHYCVAEAYPCSQIEEVGG